MIKKTDKRNAVVIMNKDQYSSEGLRQVDSAYYLKVEKPDLETVPQSNVIMIHQSKTLGKEIYRFLSTNENTSMKYGSPYLLPKINNQMVVALLKGQCSLRKNPLISQLFLNVGHQRTIKVTTVIIPLCPLSKNKVRTSKTSPILYTTSNLRLHQKMSS